MGTMKFALHSAGFKDFQDLEGKIQSSNLSYNLSSSNDVIFEKLISYISAVQ